MPMPPTAQHVSDAGSRARKRMAAAPTDHALTVVIPAHNERRRLPRTLASLGEYLDAWGVDYRVLVVDDGSRDGTAECTGGCGDRFATHSLSRQRGKGAAVRAGMLRATGAVVAFTDADLPFDLAAMRAGFDVLRARRCQVVYGARDTKGAAVRARRRLARTIASATFRHIVAQLISREVTDTQCGLKLFRREAAIEVFSRATIDGFAFDTEVVFLSRRMGLPYVRLPVTLVNEYGSTISLARHALPMLYDVLRVRWRNWRGEYDWPNDSVVTSSLDDLQSNVAHKRAA
jgi:dolichyl-phosphate beta-glucosyltransferase